MFKNMKVGRSLLLGFAISIGVSVIIIVAAILQMNSMRVQFQEVMDTNVRANDITTQIRLNANIAARNVREIALIPDSPDNPSLNESVDQMLTTIDDLFAELSQIDPLQDGSVEDYEELVNSWQDSLGQVRDRINAGDPTGAAYLIEQQETDLLSEMYTVGGELDNKLSTAQENAINNLSAQIAGATFAFIVVLLIAVVVIVVIVRMIIVGITSPTEQVRRALVGFSEGNLTIPVDYESKNELGEMCDALRTSQHILSGMIDDECYLLKEMADGNFTVESMDESLYVGALQSVIVSITEIKNKLNGVLSNINHSAEQVTSSSEQVSSGAQALSQGATEQAASVQELAATIAEISDQVSRNAENTKLGSDKAKSVGDDVMRSNELMQEMTVAMENIKMKSQEISKIIKAIEDIAFQTDILALNAAVEAARAGVAGKGFAVVADEVRNLANKSAEASKSTAVLIEDSVTAVETGSKIAEETAQTLMEVVEGAKEIVTTIDQIAEASQQQADSVMQVTQGVDQISSVVQTNSATAQQSAATSEELSGQANMLKMMVSQFRLKESDDYYSGSDYDMNDYNAY